MPNKKVSLIFSGLGLVGLVLQLFILLENLNGTNAAWCWYWPPWKCPSTPARNSDANEEHRRQQVEKENQRIEEARRNMNDEIQRLVEQQRANEANEIRNARYTVDGLFPDLENNLNVANSNEIVVANFVDGIDHWKVEMENDLQKYFEMLEDFSSSKLKRLEDFSRQKMLHTYKYIAQHCTNKLKCEMHNIQ